MSQWWVNRSSKADLSVQDALLARCAPTGFSRSRPPYAGSAGHLTITPSRAWLKFLIAQLPLLKDSLAACLKAVKAGELPRDFKCNEVGDFILSSLQGAILLSKGRRP